MYTQLEDPNNAGTYESFTCQSAYKKTNLFADPYSVIVRNYFGTGRFSETADSSENGSADHAFMDINFKDLVDDQNAVWRSDMVNKYSSYRTKYDAEMGTSSQTCTAIRAVDDTTNFKLKAGSYKFIQGFRIYESSATMQSNAKYQGESVILDAKFEGASMLFGSSLISTVAVIIGLQLF